MEEHVFYVIQEAKQIYTWAWRNWLLSVNPDVDRALGHIMDECAPFIADQPTDIEWQEFTATLPGFQSFWTSVPERTVEMLGK